ncbi:MAG: glycine cleavage system protein GcvH [Methanomassiliicoccaceae archaeon]|jgi:glycine cleavage system H protein|nr:glycine cleavage system protein GcvH [Methanomassiliicoccaceae archaeon]
MEEVRNGLLYTETHEWIQNMNDGTVVIGITDHAQNEVGDIVFVEVPKEGTELEAGEEMGAIESVKTVEPIISPVSGKVIRSNALLDNAPETVNSSPYGDGWLIVVKLKDPKELDGMMDAAAYKASIG